MVNCDIQYLKIADLVDEVAVKISDDHVLLYVIFRSILKYRYFSQTVGFSYKRPIFKGNFYFIDHSHSNMHLYFPGVYLSNNPLEYPFQK